MNIFEKIFGIKKTEKKKAEEKKQESWYNDLHEASIGHTGPMNCEAGSGAGECSISKYIAQS